MLSEFEEKRVQKIVGALVSQRRPPVSMRKEVDLDYRLKGQSVEIFELRPMRHGGGEMQEIPIAKATFVRTRGVWQLYWQRRDLKWHSYDPLPSASSIEEIVAEIDADRWGCFWG